MILRWLIVFVLLAAPFPALAETNGTSESDSRPTPLITTPDASAKSSAPIIVQPHRAVYKMALASVKNGSTVTDVSGKMMFEWSDACDGWAVQQHLQLHFSYAEGDESDVNSTVITWESKDGKRYNFNVRRVANGKETENYRGKASLKEDGSGTAIYEIPANKEMKLPEGTMFPSVHTALILDRANAGDKLFTRYVFDGSDEEGAADISAFIGARQGRMVPDSNPALAKNQLLDQSAWPVRLAFYKPTSETGEPDYEMDLTLQGNGIARAMQIDYGDFSVGGTLTDLEALPGSGC